MVILFSVFVIRYLETPRSLSENTLSAVILFPDESGRRHRLSITNNSDINLFRCSYRITSQGDREIWQAFSKNYSLEDALKLLHSISISKTNDTVELHINVKEPGLSREVTLPHPTGKTKSIAVANDETIAQIESGKTNFDVLLASPTQMAKLVKFAKILGPRGLMPNLSR